MGDVDIETFPTLLVAQRRPGRCSSAPSRPGAASSRACWPACKLSGPASRGVPARAPTRCCARLLRDVLPRTLV